MSYLLSHKASFLLPSSGIIVLLVLYAIILDNDILYLGIIIYITLQFHYANLTHGSYDLVCLLET